MVKVTKKCMRHSSTPKCIPTPLKFLLQIMFDLSKIEARGQCHSDLETVGDHGRPKMYSHTKFGTAT